MRKFYLTHILAPVFEWCFMHVPWFGDFAVEYVHELERLVHGKMLRPSVIDQLRELIRSLHNECAVHAAGTQVGENADEALQGDGVELREVLQDEGEEVHRSAAKEI